MNTQERAKAEVDAAIIDVVLSDCYQIIDELIDTAGIKNIPKSNIVKYRRILPSGYKNSFEKKK